MDCVDKSNPSDWWYKNVSVVCKLPGLPGPFITWWRTQSTVRSSGPSGLGPLMMLMLLIVYCLIEKFRVRTEKCCPEICVTLCPSGWLVLTVDSNPLIWARLGGRGSRGPAVQSSGEVSACQGDGCTQQSQPTTAVTHRNNGVTSVIPPTVNLFPGEGRITSYDFLLKLSKSIFNQLYPPTKFWRPQSVIIKAKKVFAHLPSSRPHKVAI